MKSLTLPLLSLSLLSSLRLGSSALKCYVMSLPLHSCGQFKINSDKHSSSQPAETGFSQRNGDVVMSWCLAAADGPCRQTLDRLNLRGQRSGESAGKWKEKGNLTSSFRWLNLLSKLNEVMKFQVLLLMLSRFCADGWLSTAHINTVAALKSIMNDQM